MRNRSAFLPLFTVLCIGLLLYLAKPVLAPFALAVLLSFVLSPVVDRLQKRLHFTRSAAVAVVTFSVFLVIGILISVLISQFVNLARELPMYQNNLKMKLADVKGPVGPGLERTWQTLEELGRELKLSEPAAIEPKAIEVEIREPRLSAGKMIGAMLAPILKPLGITMIVVVFTVFMLVKREELRDKVIKLIGAERITITTEAINEATVRVSRYLMMQTMINSGQGLVVGILLYVIGVPNAGMWGILSAVLRFIPYLGPWLAALMPIALSIVVFDSWTQPLLTILMFICVEIITNNVLEPWLLGSYTGISSIALVVAAVFWTWLWGAAGLLLSTPLTVCLVVLGKYIPQLRFLHVLLTDEPMLSPPERFYQRLLADDSKEADSVLQEELQNQSLEEIGETLLLPALHLAEQDLHTGALEESRYETVITRMEEAISTISISPDGDTQVLTGKVLCCPARDAADEVASLVFATLLRSKGIDAEWISADALAGELLEMVKQKQPLAICISALPPHALNHAKYLCKRLRTRFPKLPMLVGLWEAAVELEKVAETLTETGADRITRSLTDAVSHVQLWVAQDQPPSPHGLKSAIFKAD